MNANDHRRSIDDGDRAAHPIYPHQPPPQATQHHHQRRHETPEPTRPEFNLLVAGSSRGGKTSFLRLLIDTSVISPRTTVDQLASVAKFVQGCSGHTAYTRTASLDITIDIDGSGQQRPLGLTLIDTPTLDFRDEQAAERILSETARLIDARFNEGLEDERKALSGDRYVHLCIYFLDPDLIVPPSVPGPPAPPPSRTRNNSVSYPQADHEPVILEPPVMNSLPPSLPAADVAAIRHLSHRVNVLPVIARADTISNERLAAIKFAIRRDLAASGIGFGIFDTDPPQLAQDDGVAGARPTSANGYANGGAGVNGAGHKPSAPTSPTAPPLLSLPYALISPDMYSHSDGVGRPVLARPQLMQKYTPTTHYTNPSHQFIPGKYIRSYRWGIIDVLDAAHSDFLALRTAIFHHMETLQRYTQMYLFDKYRNENPSLRPATRHAPQQQQPPLPQPQSHRDVHRTSIPPISHSSRPILAIDTAPPSISHRQQQHQTIPVPHREVYSAAETRSAPAHRTLDPTPTSGTSRTSATARAKPRTKKITVACNFCRSRKLKCDGGRPTCGQCLKRSNACDYQPQNKRRGTQRPRKGEESGSDSGLDISPEVEEPSLSPEVAPVSQATSRRASNAGRQQHQAQHDGYPTSLPPMSTLSDRAPRSTRDLRRDDAPVSAPPIVTVASSRTKVESRNTPSAGGASAGASASVSVGGGGGGGGGGGSGSGSGSNTRRFYPDNEVPHIATLQPLADTAPPTPAPMSAPTLPPIRPASEQQALQRKRAATVPGKGAGAAAGAGAGGTGRQTTGSGPKVVACNFCRARKTKCDGAHPACASCARRSLACNYQHDTNGANGSKKGRASTSKLPPAPAANDESPQSVSPPSSRMIQTPSTANDAHDIRVAAHDNDDARDLKRPLEYPEMHRAAKKMRMDSNNHHAHGGIP